MDWRHHAACRRHDPELFFPVGDGELAAEQAERARDVCRGCPVASECLDWALRTGQDYGVWGGMTEQERRDLRRDTSALAAGGGARG